MQKRKLHSTRGGSSLGFELVQKSNDLSPCRPVLRMSETCRTACVLGLGYNDKTQTANSQTCLKSPLNPKPHKNPKPSDFFPP